MASSFGCAFLIFMIRIFFLVGCFLCLSLFAGRVALADSPKDAKEKTTNTKLDTQTPVLWLKSKDFGKLESHLNNLYKRVKTHPEEEYKLVLTYRALAQSYKETNANVEAWLENAPKSASAFLVSAAQQTKESADNYWQQKTSSSIYSDLEIVFQKMPDHPVAHLLYTKVLCHQINKRCIERLVLLQNKEAPNAYSARRELMSFMNPKWGTDSWVLEEYLEAIEPGIKKRAYWRPFLGAKDYFSCLKLADEKKESEALPFCEKALSFGVDEVYLRKTLSLYISLGDFAKARKAIESLQAAFPSDYWDSVTQDYADSFMRHAKIFDNKGKTSVAIQAYSEILSLFPDRLDALIARGRAYQALGQWNPAEKDFLSVIARDPDNYSAYVGLDYTLAYQKRYQEIVPYWKAYLSRNPENPQAYYEVGGTYFHLGDFKNAYQAAQKACDLGLKEACQQAERLKNR